MFDGYVLTGGKSSRMKTAKAALRFGDATFAERAVAALQKIAAGRVSFVAAHQPGEADKLLPADVPLIRDHFPNKAALGAIYTALEDAKTEWAIITACDFPFATAELFARLAEIAAASNKKINVVAPVQPDGRVQPLCTLYRVKPCLKAARRLLNPAETLPARRLLETVETRLVRFDELQDLGGAENFFVNINTPEDYRRFARQ